MVTQIKERPFTWTFFGLYVLYQLLYIWCTGPIPGSVNTNINISLSAGLLASLAAYQWQLNNLLVQPLVLLLAIFNFTILEIDPCFTTERTIAYGAVFTVFVFAIFFRPFIGSKESEPMAYTINVFIVLAKFIITSFVTVVAVRLIFVAIGLLLGVLNNEIEDSFLVILGFAVPFAIFLSSLPNKKPEEFNILWLSRFAKIVLLPFAVIYIAVLYIYGLKILFLWNLPRDSICKMVAGITLVSLAVMYFLRGYLFSSESSSKSKTVAKVATRLIPALLLPLLVLMSVAILYRICQYGITSARLYVAGFNLWAYGVAIYILLKKNPNFNALACSFAFAFGAVSVVPGFNLYTLGSHYEQPTEDNRDYPIVIVDKDFHNIECENLTVSPVPQAKSVRIIRYDTPFNLRHVANGYVPCEIDDSVKFDFPVDSLINASGNGLKPEAFFIINDNRTIAVTDYHIHISEKINSYLSFTAILFEK